MIPLTTLPSSEDNTPVHYPRRRLVEQHGLGYGQPPPACSGFPYGSGPYGHQHQMVVRGSPRHGQYTTQDYLMPPPAAVRRQTAEPRNGDEDGTDWNDSWWRVLTCDGLCTGRSRGEQRSKALMVDAVSRVLFPIMFIIFNIIYWPIYLM